MRRAIPRLAAVGLLVLNAVPAGAQVALDAVLSPYLEKYDLPALGAAVVREGEIVAVGAVGTRRVGVEIPVTLHDRFHIGSDTKAMTALLAAELVQEEKLRWDSTVAEVLPELAKGLDPRLRRVTLAQLLSHTSGLPGDDAAFGDLLGKSLLQSGNLDALRLWLVGEYGRRPLVAEPGTTFAYANMGFVMAGAMLERAGGKTWEELVGERIFTPLGLSSAGFGPQSTPGKVDAPLGHLDVDGKRTAFLAGPDGDNPAIIGPAGSVHLSLLDFARWAGWNAGEGKRGPALVAPETLKKLHTPVIAMPTKPDAAPGTPSRGAYGLGWGQVQMEWSELPFVHHGGSNTKNLAHIWLQPENDFAMVTVTNVAGARAEQALLALAAELYQRFGPPKRAFASATGRTPR